METRLWHRVVLNLMSSNQNQVISPCQSPRILAIQCERNKTVAAAKAQQNVCKRSEWFSFNSDTLESGASFWNQSLSVVTQKQSKCKLRSALNKISLRHCLLLPLFWRDILVDTAYRKSNYDSASMWGEFGLAMGCIFARRNLTKIPTVRPNELVITKRVRLSIYRTQISLEIRPY